MPFLAIPDFSIQRRQKIKGYVGWLKFLWVSLCDVVHQRSKRGRPGRRNRVCARCQCRCMNSSHKPGGDRLHVSLDATNLPGEQHARMFFHLQSLRKQRRCIDVGIAMDLPITQEAGVFEPGNQTQDTCLLAEFQMILETDQVVGIGPQILLPQLHRCVRNAPGSRIFQSDRLHGAEAQSVAAAPGDLFDGQAAFKVIQLLPFTLFDRLCCQQGIVEAVVFFPRHGAVDVIG